MVHPSCARVGLAQDGCTMSDTTDWSGAGNSSAIQTSRGRVSSPPVESLIGGSARDRAPTETWRPGFGSGGCSYAKTQRHSASHDSGLSADGCIRRAVELPARQPAAMQTATHAVYRFCVNPRASLCQAAVTMGPTWYPVLRKRKGRTTMRQFSARTHNVLSWLVFAGGQPCYCSDRFECLWSCID